MSLSVSISDTVIETGASLIILVGGVPGDVFFYELTNKTSFKNVEKTQQKLKDANQIDLWRLSARGGGAVHLSAHQPQLLFISLPIPPSPPGLNGDLTSVDE